MTAGIMYVALGLTATFAAAFVAASPPLLIEAVAGLALLGSLAASLQAALVREDERLPAILTFVVAASGVSFAGSARRSGRCSRAERCCLSRVRRRHPPVG